MKGIAKIMGKMNKKMNLPKIQEIMQEFEKQNEVRAAATRAASVRRPVCILRRACLAARVARAPMAASPLRRRRWV